MKKALKKHLEGLSQKVRMKQAAVAAAVMSASGVASANTTPSPAVNVIQIIQDAFASVTGVFTEVNAQMWLLAVPITLAFIGLRLFRRGANSAVG